MTWVWIFHLNPANRSYEEDRRRGIVQPARRKLYYSRLVSLWRRKCSSAAYFAICSNTLCSDEIRVTYLQTFRPFFRFFKEPCQLCCFIERRWCTTRVRRLENEAQWFRNCVSGPVKNRIWYWLENSDALLFYFWITSNMVSLSSDKESKQVPHFNGETERNSSSFCKTREKL